MTEKKFFSGRAERNGAKERGLQSESLEAKQKFVLGISCASS